MAIQTCTITGTVYGPDGNPMAAAEVSYRLVDPPAGSGNVFSGGHRTATADDGGAFAVPAVRGAEYELWFERGQRFHVTTPTDADTVACPRVFGSAAAPRL